MPRVRRTKREHGGRREFHDVIVVLSARLSRAGYEDRIARVECLGGAVEGRGDVLVE